MNSLNKALEVFLYTAGVILLLTGGAKLYSATGNAGVLNLDDPLFLVPNRYLLIGVGTIEVGLALHLLFKENLSLQLTLVAWLSTGFLLYRLALLWMGSHQPCGCLGTLGDRLRLHPDTVDLLMKAFLGFLFLSSYVFLALTRLRRISPAETAVSQTSEIS